MKQKKKITHACGKHYNYIKMWRLVAFWRCDEQRVPPFSQRSPRPDYWTGLLFKRLMGSTVLTSYQTEPAVMPYIPEMRGYAHCTPSTAAGQLLAP